jgi:hypothetical protein
LPVPVSAQQHAGGGFGFCSKYQNADEPFLPSSRTLVKHVHVDLSFTEAKDVLFLPFSKQQDTEPHCDAPFSFSACLLVKDDNKILPEWLAYHYEVLPLRRLIIAIDPLSTTSPEPILQAYRKIGMNITVSTLMLMLSLLRISQP